MIAYAIDEAQLLVFSTSTILEPPEKRPREATTQPSR